MLNPKKDKTFYIFLLNSQDCVSLILFMIAQIFSYILSCCFLIYFIFLNTSGLLIIHGSDKLIPKLKQNHQTRIKYLNSKRLIFLSKALKKYLNQDCIQLVLEYLKPIGK